jgi:nitrogen-specific signal transduction histidine kinase
MNELFAQLEFLEKLLRESNHDIRTQMIINETIRLDNLIERFEGQIRIDFGDGMEV